MSDSQPARSQGATTQPVGTQGVGTQGVGTQPVGTQPVGTQGVGTQGVGTLAPRVDRTTDLLLGSGRAGIVFKSEDDQGRITARKVFDSDALTRAVQYLFLGAPNPYAWCVHAVQAAMLRRRILAPLVRHWLGGRARVAEAWSVDWNEEHLAWQLHTQFVDGAHPTLHHPMNRRGAEEVNELRHEVMAPLLTHLMEAGFDGQVWQAGLGNPVALANFMMEKDEQGRRRWVWIDLESGVPALFPASLVALFRFYLPRTWKYRHPLFDDVDTARLTSWLHEHRAELVESLSAPIVEGIERDTAALGHHQESWRSMSRLERSISSQRAKNRLTDEQVTYYESHALLWYAREGRRAVRGVSRRVGRKVSKGYRLLRDLPWRRLGKGLVAFLISQRFRAQIAERFLESRIELWSNRSQLTDHEANELRSHLGREESSVYLTDFGVHVAIKPFVKSIEWFFFPALYAAGVIDQTTLTIILLAGGSVGRTLYTAGRFVQSLVRGRELPWIALGVGVLPVIGNLAYPLQIVGSSHEKQDILAQFILYDACSVLGRRLPIWGGPDTLTEHWFNHLPDLVVARGVGGV